MLMDTTSSAPSSHIISVPHASGQRSGDPIPVSFQGNAPAGPQHGITEVGTDTKPSDLNKYIVKTKQDNKTYHSCGHPTCSDRGRFSSRKKVIFHIRHAHLEARSYKCATWYAQLVSSVMRIDTIDCLQRKDLSTQARRPETL